MRAAALVALPAGWAWGQGGAGAGSAPEALVASEQPTVDPLDIMGQTFAGLRLPLAPVPGVVGFEASHAWVWIDEDAGGPVQRLLLEGDVRVTLGDSLFEAKRAVVWMQRLREPGEGPGDARTHQVFVYFDGVGSIGADAGTALSARRLSVDGVVMSGEPVRLAVDLAEEGRPRDGFVREAEREFTRYLRELATGRRVDLEEVEEPLAPGPGAEVAGGRYPPPPLDRDLLLEAPVLADAGDEIFAAEGVITFDAGDVALVSGESGRSLMLTGGVSVLYRDTESSRRLQMSAQRAVVFLTGGAIADLASFKSEDVLGLYLEGDVIVTDGDYTLRGPRVYYDVPRDRALIVDAVFWTYDRRMGMPLYVRADALRQESNREFVAERATVSNTRFAKPHISLGVEELTVRRYARADGTSGNMVDASGVTAMGGRVPFLWWPRWVGDPQRFPLRDARVESSSRTGPAWKTTWDLYTLLGLERPEGLGSDFLFDYYNERGFAVGTATDWKTAQMRGGVFGYLLFDDRGTDLMPNGGEVEVDSETRGLILAENRWRLNNLWSLTVEGAYLSDERLAEALFRDIAQERRELTTRARLERTDEVSQLALEAKGSLNDFISNEYLLESRGYSVSKLPELSYVRLADDLAPELWPGVFTLSSEYRVGRLALEFDEATAAERGYVGSGISNLAFGIEPGQSPGDALRAMGLSEDAVWRADTRHEISTVLNAGPVRINPFVVGRASGYDTDFDEFSPDEEDNVRLWGSAGVRVSTTVQRVDNSVESDFLDLHRVRHIVEPGVTVWHSGSTIDRVDLPVYDDSVESLIEGTMVRAGLDQTWQTKRGGPGRWRNVDVFTLRTEYVWASGDVDREYPIGHWFEDRPELSNPGEFVDAEALWQVSDPVGITGRIIYDVEETHQPAYSTLGMIIDHDDRLRSSLGQRFVNELDSTLLFYNLNCELTEKYRAGFEMTYNSDVDTFDRVSVAVRRDYPNVTVGFSYSYNFIGDESSIGFILSPRGLSAGLGVRTGPRDEEGARLGG